MLARVRRIAVIPAANDLRLVETNISVPIGYIYIFIPQFSIPLDLIYMFLIRQHMKLSNNSVIEILKVFHSSCL